MRPNVLTSGAFFVAASAVLTPQMKADPILTTFSEQIVVATDTFETSTGAFLYEATGLGIGDWLSPNIAGDLESDPAQPAQVQALASLFPEVSEVQFLTEQGPGYILLNGSGPVLTDPTDLLDVEGALAAQAGSGFILPPISDWDISTVGVFAYTTGGLEPDGTLVEGTVNFNVYNESVVEREVSVSATPEPGSLLLVLTGSIAALISSSRFAVTRQRRKGSTL